MTRFYDDCYDEDFNNQGLLQWENMERALAGRKGIAALRELKVALEELPAPRLLYGHLAQAGDVCAIGAMIVKRRVDRGEARAAVIEYLERFAEEPARVTAEKAKGELDMTMSLAYRIAYENDEYGRATETPEDVYARVHGWVSRFLENYDKPLAVSA